MQEIIEKVREEINGFIKKAILDYNQDPNPECAFDYYVPSVTDQILSHPNIAIIDPDAELPQITPTEYPIVPEAVSAQRAQQDILKAGYRKVVKQ